MALAIAGLVAALAAVAILAGGSKSLYMSEVEWGRWRAADKALYEIVYEEESYYAENGAYTASYLELALSGSLKKNWDIIYDPITIYTTSAGEAAFKFSVRHKGDALWVHSYDSGAGSYSKRRSFMQNSSW